MANRIEFLRLVWTEIINASLSGNWIENTIAASDNRPDDPFSDVGPALKRLIARGVDREDLNLIVRGASYEAAFALLYMLGDPGVDGDDINMLHEELLTTDPTGMEGRPGSALAAKSSRLQQAH